MRFSIALLVICSITSATTVYGESTLLEKVKGNPSESKALCKKFEALNAKGIKTSSKEVIEEISRTKNLTPTDAEILSMYVIAYYCPQIKLCPQKVMQEEQLKVML